MSDARTDERQRRIIYRRSGRRCYYCLAEINFRTFHCEHMTPLCKGGKTRVDNLVASCEPCNMAKWKMDSYQFERVLSQRGLGWRDKMAMRNRMKVARKNRGRPVINPAAHMKWFGN